MSCNNRNEKICFDKLPELVLQKILSYLNFPSRRNARLVCLKFRREIDFVIGLSVAIFDSGSSESMDFVDYIKIIRAEIVALRKLNYCRCNFEFAKQIKISCPLKGSFFERNGFYNLVDLAITSNCKFQFISFSRPDFRLPLLNLKKLKIMIHPYSSLVDGKVIPGLGYVFTILPLLVTPMLATYVVYFGSRYRKYSGWEQEVFNFVNDKPKIKEIFIYSIIPDFQENQKLEFPETLKTLGLLFPRYYRPRTEHVDEYKQIILSQKNLQSLNSSFIPGLFYSDMKPLIEGNCATLESCILYFRHSMVLNLDGSIFKDCSKLKVLKLYIIQESVLQSTFRNLKQLPRSLERFEISGTKISTDHLVELKRFPKLKYLHLGFITNIYPLSTCGVTVKCVRTIMENRTLEGLKIDCLLGKVPVGDALEVQEVVGRNVQLGKFVNSIDFI